MFGQRLQVALGPEQEHAAVPEIATLGQQLAGARGVRLLDEGVDAPGRRSGRHLLLALPDVAVAGFRMGGHDAEGHQTPRLRGWRGGLHRRLESRHVADDMVGRQYQQQRLGIGAQGRQRDRRRGVATDRLEDDGLGRDPQLAQLFRDEEAVRFVAHHDGLRHRDAVETLDGLLQHRAIAHQGQQLLGVQLARDRPQAGARTAGQYDRGNHGRRF